MKFKNTRGFILGLCLSLYLQALVPIQGLALEDRKAKAGQEEWSMETKDNVEASFMQETFPGKLDKWILGVVREETAALWGNVEKTLSCGQTVYLLDALYTEEGYFLKVAFYENSELRTGLVRRENIVTTDQEFLEAELETEAYVMASQSGMAWKEAGDGEETGEGGETGDGEETGEGEETGDGEEAGEDEETGDEDREKEINYDFSDFPESYRGLLTSLKESHPNWYFVPMDTGVSFSYAVDEESKNDRSWISKSVPDYMRGEAADKSGSWYYPTRATLEYYMDPRNSLTESLIFQHELLTYNESYHTEGAVDLFLDTTFMNNQSKATNTDLTYAQIFFATGREQNISPFHLAARVHQEQGKGTSPLISGTYPGYEGYYNYFNINASGKTNQEVIVNGLTHAKKQGWTDAYLSIYGGSSVVGGKYILKGQDTLYLQKFNVNPNGYYNMFTHQYMQNIMAPFSESKQVKAMYAGANSLDNSFVFRIPVYRDMPDSPCPLPTKKEDTPFSGWYEENGEKYWYENGIRQGTEGRGKEIFDPQSGAWYWLEGEFGGRMARDKDVYQESYGGKYSERPDGMGKWVRYDTNGHMIKGVDYRNGGWYRFDEETGAMVKGWYEDEKGDKYYYAWDIGQRVHGRVVIDGIERYFDENTGILADKVWYEIDGKEYWYEDGIRQGYDPMDPAYRGKEIYDPQSKAWYWLDNCQQGAKAVSKDVYQESLAGEYGAYVGADGLKYGKWVRYDENGYMIKGWNTTSQGNTYYFDPVYGSMARGRVRIDGREYFFNEITGILEASY